MEKYIEMYYELVEKKGFRYTIDYFGAYFFGLIDNISYNDFINYFYNDFIDFTNWLCQTVSDYTWEVNYKDEQPFLYKLVEVIQETNAQPDSLQEALVKSFTSLNGKDDLFKLADDLIAQKKQIVMTVATFDENSGEELYCFDAKYTKVFQKNNADKVKLEIVMALSLAIKYNGIISFFLREKGKEKIYAFEGQDNKRIYSLTEEELEDIYEDYIINNKDKEIELYMYYFKPSNLN